MTTGTTAVPPRDDDLINEATKSYRDAVVNGKTGRTRKLPTSDDKSNNADTEMRKVSKKQRRDAIEQTACHDRDNSRLAPSKNARHTRASAAPLNRTPASERAMRARSLLVPIFVKSIFALYLLYLDSSLSSRHIGIHMYPSALRPSCFTFYD